MTRGKLIVFEGLDRAGKSTQCEKLVEDLQNDGVKVRHMRFPGMCTLYGEIVGVGFGGNGDSVVKGSRLTWSLDRTTRIGQMINSYLSGESEQEDHVIHLLFSANRWEAV